MKYKASNKQTMPVFRVFSTFLTLSLFAGCGYFSYIFYDMHQNQESRKYRYFHDPMFVTAFYAVADRSGRIRQNDFAAWGIQARHTTDE